MHTLSPGRVWFLEVAQHHLDMCTVYFKIIFYYCFFIIFPTDHSGQQNKYAMVQYWFDGPPVTVKPKPHSNSHSSTPYFRTADSAKEKHKEIAASSKPTEALYKATQQCGGEMEATTTSQYRTNKKL